MSVGTHEASRLTEGVKAYQNLLFCVQGTNGGVTWTGLVASLAGGLFMGLVFWSMGAISPRLYTVPFQQEPAIGQWSLVMLGRAIYMMVYLPAFYPGRRLLLPFYSCEACLP